VLWMAAYAASALVFPAFTMKGIVKVRLIALCSNFAFLTYGIGLHLLPVAAHQATTRRD
jgi:hypothetical protein